MTTKEESIFVNENAKLQFSATDDMEKLTFEIKNYGPPNCNRWQVEEFVVCKGRLYLGLKKRNNSFPRWVEDKEIVRVG